MNKVKLGEINKTNRKLIASIKEYHGRTYLDLREHFYSAEKDAWLPTKKGITITNPQAASKMVELLQKGISTLRW
jgi:hypothetical protein|tara:strand:+ start:491 stop:715 length:225 start_codon:yes stop_codon:yes gene_type:complete